jgi:hypothetical protein
LLALSNDESLVYIGGDFSQIGGVVFRRLAALDAATGSRDASFAVGTPNQPVNDVAVRPSGQVLFAGSFTSVGGTRGYDWLRWTASPARSAPSTSA